MAGGYQKPKGPRPPAGPGKLSQRTDANQPVTTPGLDNPDIQYGDVSKLRAGMSAAPLPQAGTLRSARPGGGIRPASRAGGLPDFVTNSPTSRPNEPGTEGLSTGAGAGPEVLPPMPIDERLQILKWDYQVNGNQQSLEYSRKIMDELGQQQQQSMAPPPGRPAA